MQAEIDVVSVISQLFQPKDMPDALAQSEPQGSVGRVGRHFRSASVREMFIGE